jgi:predicted regulator of Ras-like GTPase activity (Roadblock/LC7/MglB family)
MAERQNTMVCSFDLSSPRIMVYDIHELIFAVLRIPEHTVKMIHVDGIKRYVYIKLADTESVLALLWDTAGLAK